MEYKRGKLDSRSNYYHVYIHIVVMRKKKNIFTEKEIEALNNLGDVLRDIRARLIREGKLKVVDGKTVRVEEEK